MTLYHYKKVLDDFDIRCHIDRDNGDNGGGVEVSYEIDFVRERLSVGVTPSCLGTHLQYTVERFGTDPIFDRGGNLIGMTVRLLLRIDRPCAVNFFGYLTVTQHSADGTLEPEEFCFGLEGPAITSMIIDGDMLLVEHEE